MCDFAVDLDVVAPNADFREELAMLAPMQWDGLTETDSKTLTEAERPVVRGIAAAFDTCRRPQTTRFSKAI